MLGFNLKNNIEKTDSPLLEFKQEDYSGTCSYDPLGDIYYIDNLLIGTKRLVSLTLKEGQVICRFNNCIRNDFSVKEIARLPTVYLETVPFYKTSVFSDKLDRKLLMDRGIVFYGDNIIMRIENGIEKKYLLSLCCGKFDIKRRSRSKANVFKGMGYFITVPIDIITFPVQLVIWMNSMKN